MDSGVLLQIVLTIGGTFAGLFAMFRFFIQQSVKRERTMLEYFETKNGHMERMSKDFTKASNNMAKAINKLSTKVEIQGNNNKQR